MLNDSSMPNLAKGSIGNPKKIHSVYMIEHGCTCPKIQDNAYIRILTKMLIASSKLLIPYTMTKCTSLFQNLLYSAITDWGP